MERKTGCLSETEEGIKQAKRYLESSLFNELDASVELPKFVVAPTRVCENLDTVEAHEDMRATKTQSSSSTANNNNKRPRLIGYCTSQV
jgi:hypothetical protein